MITTIPKTLIQTDPATGQQITRTWHVHIPSQGASGRPVLFFFHGHGGNGLNFASQPNFGYYANKGYVIVFPDAYDIPTAGPSWVTEATVSGQSGFPPNMDEDFVMSMISALVSEYNVDATKVYAGAFSMGTQLCYQLWLRQSGSFKAFSTAGGGERKAFDALFASASPPPRPWLSAIGQQDSSWTGDAEQWGAIETKDIICARNNRSNVAVPPAGQTFNPIAGGTKYTVFNYDTVVNGSNPSAQVVAIAVQKVTQPATHRWFAKPPTHPDDFFMTSACIEFWKTYAGLPAEL